MNNEIRKFDFRGAALRTLTDEAGEPWFVAKDVCDILGTDTRDLHKILESDEITNVDSIHIAQNGGKAPLIISEPGLYRLVMKSRKPEAKEFQRWVTHEVLPSIRKHGGYMAGQERMTPEQMALASMRWLQSKVDEQAKQLKAQEGKVLFANAVETARTSILVGDFAKILKSNGIDIGPRRLFAWLREHGWLIKAKGSSWNMPTQKAMDLHLFEVKETTVSHSDGHTTINKTPKMTDNDYRIEDRFEKGRPNYTLRRLKFALAVVGLVVSVTLMLTWHGGGLTGVLVVEGVYLATVLWLTVRFAPRDDVDGDV